MIGVFCILVMKNVMFSFLDEYICRWKLCCIVRICFCGDILKYIINVIIIENVFKIEFVCIVDLFDDYVRVWRGGGF